MNLNLLELNIDVVKKISIKDKVEIPKDFYTNTEIKDLKEIQIDGTIYKDSAGIITLEAILSGIMVLEDSINLELIDYQFSCDIDEKIEDFDENYTKPLDITEILWQNIVLEVPLKFTRVESFDEYQGDGWKLISEESVNTINNPFNELKDMIGEE